MVYSPELGYDPDEWEECQEEPFLALSLFTRICLGVGTLLLAAFFFWLLEVNKRKAGLQRQSLVDEGDVKNVAIRVEADEEESRTMKSTKMREGEEEEEEEEQLSVQTRLDRASQEAEQKANPERRRSSKRTLSQHEVEALQAWEAEVHRLEQERLRTASEEPVLRVHIQTVDDEPMPPFSHTQQTEDISKIPDQLEPIGIDQQKQDLHQQQHAPWQPLDDVDHSSAEERSQEQKQSEPMQIGSVKLQPTTEQQPSIIGMGLKEECWPTASTTSELLSKASEETRKIAYADDLLSAANAPRQQQQLYRDQELEQQPIDLLAAPKPRELIRLHIESIGAPGATPPCTPPSGVPLADMLPELAAYYRQMAEELTQKLLAEMDELAMADEADAPALTAELQNRHRERIDERLGQSGAPEELRQHLARQLESHMATVVNQEMKRRTASSTYLQRLATDLGGGRRRYSESAGNAKAYEKQQFLPLEAGDDDAGRRKPSTIVEIAMADELALMGKTSSSSSDEGDFVKIHGIPTSTTSAGAAATVFIKDEAEVVATSGDVSPFIVANTPISPRPVLVIEQRLTPSPNQLVTTTDEEEGEPAAGADGTTKQREWHHGEEENVRVSMLSAGGGSTTADDIEFVPSAGPSPLPPPMHQAHLQQQQQQQHEKPFMPITPPAKKHRTLEAEEAEQVAALLQEYDLSVIGEMPRRLEEGDDQRQLEINEQRQREETEQRMRQISSGAASAGIISLPESAQRTPAGPSSLPESPGSPGYDFINFPAATIEEPQLVPLTESPQYVQKQQRDTTLKTITTIEMVERQLRMGEEENEQFVQLLEEQKELARRRRRSDKQQPAGEIESDAIAAAVEPMVVDAGTIGASTTLQKEPVCAEAHTAIEERKPLHGGEKQRVEAQFKIVSVSVEPQTSSGGGGKSADQRRVVDHDQAELYLQQALDYISTERQQQQQQKPTTTKAEQTQKQQTDAVGNEEQQQKTPLAGKKRFSGTQFVLEEEMLESDEGAAAVAAAPAETPKAERKESKRESRKKEKESTGTAGADGTSKQIRTNEVFDKPDPMFLYDDVDDRDVTYAPEIQSMEIPPDEIGGSQADSLNLVEENFSEQHEIVAPTTRAKTGMAAEQKKLDERQKHAEGQQSQRKQESAIGKEEREEVPEQQQQQQRELTPREEEQLQREIDQLRRTSSPRLLPDVPKAQAPQAPQFLRSYFNDDSDSLSSTSIRQSSLLSAVGVSSTQEMLLRLNSLEALSGAMRKAGLESSNLIFGIDYTASNKYQGERSFDGRSLHSVDDPHLENPYQQVIKIMGRTLAPFAGHEHGIPVFGFGDSTTGDWSVFPLNGTAEGECTDLNDVLRVYNRITPSIDLSGPTNFAPLIYRSMEICHKRKDYHILVIIADGQVTNERATRKAIVNACQYPLSIIVVGVGDGPWEMMRVFDESLPKRPWDNFHFVEFHAMMNNRNGHQKAGTTIGGGSNEQQQQQQTKEMAFAVHSLLEIPDQYNTIRKLGMLLPTYYTRPQPHSPRSYSPRPKPQQRQQQK